MLESRNDSGCESIMVTTLTNVQNMYAEANAVKDITAFKTWSAKWNSFITSSTYTQFKKSSSYSVNTTNAIKVKLFIILFNFHDADIMKQL